MGELENLIKSWILALSLVVSCVALADAAPRSHQLSMVDLGTLGGRFGSANALNNRNQVVGESQTTTFASHAFLWKDGTMADLGTLPGHNISIAYDINDRGQIVGFSGGPGVQGRAVLWKRGAIVDLGLPQDAGGCEARAINTHGEIAGDCGFGDEQHAVIWDRGQIVDLGTLPGSTYTRVSAISDRGVVAGLFETASREFHAFVWDRGTMTDLGTLPGGSFSNATSINKHGQIAGFSNMAPNAGGPGMSVIWERGRGAIWTITLVIPNSQAYGINKHGQLVGVSDQGPFLWSDGTMIELPTLPSFDGATPFAVNDHGSVAGQASRDDGDTHAVLWMK